MKKLLGVLLLVLVLVLSCAAFAEEGWEDQWGNRDTYTAPFVPESRVGLSEIDLLPFFKGSTNYADGVLNVVIDDAQTDWEGILSHGGGVPNIVLGYTVKNPDPSKYHRAGDVPGGVYWGSEEDAQEEVFRMILNYLEDVFVGCDSMEIDDMLMNLEAEDYSNSNEVGEVVRAQSLLSPMNTDGYGVYLGWYNIAEMWNLYQLAEGNEDVFKQAAASRVYFEHVGMTISHTSEDAFHVPVKFVSEYSLAPSADISRQEYNGITFDTESFKPGEVSFIVDPAQVSRKPVEGEGEGEGDSERMTVSAFIRPPEHLEGVANEAFVYDEWGDYELLEVGDDGLLWITLDYDIHSDQVEERSFVISWARWREAQEGEVPGEGEVLDEWGFINTPLGEYGQFYFHVVPKDVKPWPGYVTADHEYGHGIGWKPVPAERVHIVDTESNALPTYANMTYDEDTGILNAGFKADATITGDTADVKVTIDPPSTDKTWYYRTNRSGGNRLMGRYDDMVRDMDEICQYPDDFGGEITWPMTGAITAREYPLLKKVYAGPVEVYLQTESVWEYGGAAQVIYWYDDPDAPAEEPVMIEYICETFEELSVEVESDCVLNEEDITEPVTQITGVGSHCRGWKLIIRYDLQRGHNAIHYDLHLEDEYGNHRQPEPGKPMVFYMPYPEGTSPAGGHYFDLRHYSTAYSGGEIMYTSDEKIEVVQTEYGLRFTVSSLSPFTLEWNDGSASGGEDSGEDEAVPVPPTGDHTPVMLLGLLLLVSLCGVVLTARRQRAK